MVLISSNYSTFMHCAYCGAQGFGQLSDVEMIRDGKTIMDVVLCPECIRELHRGLAEHVKQEAAK